MQYDILRDFKGSQDGRVTESFEAGTRRELSDYLAAIVVPEGWARPVKAAADDVAPVKAARKGKSHVDG